MANNQLTDQPFPPIGTNGKGRAPSTPSPRLWLKVRYRLTPWWVKVVVIFVLSRVITTAILLGYASVQPANPWTVAQPDYFSFASIWDGHWYLIVAVAGYPSTLPLTQTGHVGESAWAFLPAYPALVRTVMALTGLSFEFVAVVVSVLFALAGALMFYRLMRLVLPAQTALFSVVLWCVAPLSPIFQVAYAESMQSFLLIVALYFLLKRDYWLAMPVVAVLALTRPSGLAFALAMLLHVCYRWFTRRTDPFPRGELIAAASLGLFSAIMGVVWPLVAWLMTGSKSAYIDTELAWRSAYVGYRELVPFEGWLQGAQFWIGGAAGYVVLALAVVAFAGFLFIPPVRKLGIDLRLWVASYVLYLLAVFFPQSSTFRLLIPIFPLWGAIAVPRSWIYRIAIVLVCIAAQWGWVHIAWWYDGYDWTPP